MEKIGWVIAALRWLFGVASFATLFYIVAGLLVGSVVFTIVASAAHKKEEHGLAHRCHIVATLCGVPATVLCALILYAAKVLMGGTWWETMRNMWNALF